MSVVDLPAGLPVADRLPPLVPGDHLDQPTFHARYLAMPAGTRAELVEGVVYMPPPPVGEGHSTPHGDIVYWLNHHKRFTPGVGTLNDATTILGNASQPQPDAALRLLVGGQTTLNADGYVAGCPELVVEVANGTVAYDLHAKRRDYQRHGAQEYLAVVVRDRRVIRFARHGRRLVETPPDADGVHRSIAFPGLWLDPAALLAGDLNRLAAVLEDGMATPAHAALVAGLKARGA